MQWQFGLRQRSGAAFTSGRSRRPIQFTRFGAGCLVSCSLVLTSCNNPSPIVGSSPVPSPALSPSPTPTPLPAPGETPATPSPVPSALSDSASATERQLAAAFTESTDLKLTTLTCPDETTLRPPFRCQAVTEAQSFTIGVQSATDGQWQWQTEGLLQLSKLETLLQQEVQQSIAGEVRADCGSVRVQSAQVQKSFTCRLQDQAGQTRSVRVTVQDERGNVSFALEPATVNE